MTPERGTMRGILLAGGSASRLRPVSNSLSKQMLPVYDKPMIYYPLSTLLRAGITEILIISTAAHLPAFRSLLGNGSELGIRLDYAVQPRPRGIAEALSIGADFVGDQDVALILGDNVFCDPDLGSTLERELSLLNGCTLFGYEVPDPQRYGVAVVDESGRVTELDEKPARPASNLAVTGLYLYRNEVLRHVDGLAPSGRGELEITDLNRVFVDQGRARLAVLPPESMWFDTGTIDSLLEAALYVRELAQNQGVHLGYVEEAALEAGLIGPDELDALIRRSPVSSAYERRLRQLADTARGVYSGAAT